MFLAARTVRRLKTIALVALVYCVLVSAAAFLWPAADASPATAYMRWLFGIPVALGLCALLELVGQSVLSLSFWSRMPSWVRIGLLVVLVSSVTVLVVWVQHLMAAQNAA